MRNYVFAIGAVFCLVGTMLAQIPVLQVETAAYQTQNAFPTLQSSQPNAMTISTGDTLRYFLNKHFYRNSNAGNPTPNTQYFTLSNPYTTTLNISHGGSTFLNSSPITVTGLEGIVTVRPNSSSQNIPLKLYLCNVNAANLPILPPLDSVTAVASATTNGAWLGANFNTPVVVNGKFAVLFRCASTVAGDTLGLFINNACTPTSTCPVARRYGEGLSVMRINGTFQLNTNLFGTGTDYEFIVAPRVQFNYTSGIQVLTPTICTNSAGSFSNTTSPMPLVENRQFNFNKFAAVWGALSNTLLPTTDSIYNWSFSGSSTGPLTTKNATAIFTANGIQTASLAVKYNKSRVGGLLPSVEDVAVATINASSTNAPTISIAGNSLICAGSQATLTVSGNNTYTWSNPPSNSSVVVVSPNSTTAYTVAADNGACLGYQTFTVNVVSPPNVVITGPSQACFGGTVLLTASGASSYTWSTGSTAYSTNVTPSMIGVQFFTVSGETSPCAPVSVVKSITVNPLPSVSLSSPVSTVCSISTGGSTVQLTGLPSGGVYSGNFVNNGVFSPNAVMTASLFYTFTDPSTQCAGTASTTIGVLACSGTGITESAALSKVQVYPNPSLNGKFELSHLEGRSAVTVYSSLGAVLVEITTTAPELLLDLSEQSNGVYFVKLASEKGLSKTVKVVVQK